MNRPEDRIRQMVRATRSPGIQPMPYTMDANAADRVKQQPYFAPDHPAHGIIQTMPYYTDGIPATMAPSVTPPAAPQYFQPSNPRPMPRPPVRMDAPMSPRRVY